MRSWHLRSPSELVSSHPRRGGISVVAMVVLLVTSLLIAQYVRRAVNDRRQTRVEADRMQAQSLAEAGLLVAATAVANDPTWTGTEWNLPAGTVHQTNTGSVVISLKDGLCTVVARYPSNSSSPIQVTRRETLVQSAPE